ncbi:MAG: hypothetical protein SF339_24065 [Blastocatellia bacterium]|nr:hypothetical protein [Blastocatellia bacterium]
MKNSLVILVLALFLSGCGSSPSESKPSAASPSPTVAAATSEAEHAHSAPHGGMLVEFGEEFAHLEIVLDAAAGRLTAYALDGEAEASVRVKQPAIEIAVKKPAATVVKLGGVANGLTGETAGDTSEFTGQSDALKGQAEFEGVIKTISIKGRSFTNVAFQFPKGNEAK